MRFQILLVFAASIGSTACDLGPSDTDESKPAAIAAELSETVSRPGAPDDREALSGDDPQSRIVPGRFPDPTAPKKRFALPDFIEHPPARVPPIPFPHTVAWDNGSRRLDKAEALRPVSKKLVIRGGTSRSPDAATDQADPIESSRPVESEDCNIFGVDDRTEVMQTTEYPFSAVAKIYIRSGSSWYAGSAAIVRPDFALTAGHCLYNSESRNWADEIVVVPAKTPSSEPFDSTYAIELISVSGWTESGDLNYDIGIIKLAEPIGESTGTLGYAAFDSAALRASRLTSTGYPGDRGGSIMTTSAAATYALVDDQICSNLDVCKGESGSPAWPGTSNMVAGVMSGWGGDCNLDSMSYTRLTRISPGIFDWLEANFEGCPCLVGECCDGCNFRHIGSLCDSPTTYEYRCAGETCGSNAQRRQGTRTCSGNSPLCDGSIVWGDWETIADCNENEGCQSDRQANAKCTSCPFGCKGGYCCVCESGPCCDGCRYYSFIHACDPGFEAQFQCDGSSCGSNAQQMSRPRHCTGASSICEGPYEGTKWVTIEDCGDGQLCQSDNVSFARCTTCPLGCTGAACCTCSAGACCDGCSFRSSDFVCEPAFATESRCGDNGSGTAFVERKVSDRYCSGGAANCAGDVKDTPWERVETCDSRELCLEDTSGAACAPDPSRDRSLDRCSSGLCCDTSVVPYGFASEAVVCELDLDHVRRCVDEDGYAGDGCGRTLLESQRNRHCSGTSSACDGRLVESAWQTVMKCAPFEYCDFSRGCIPRESCSSGDEAATSGCSCQTGAGWPSMLFVPVWLIAAVSLDRRRRQRLLR